jgi:hypothetical protein
MKPPAMWDAVIVQVWLVLELCGGGNLQDSNAKPKTRFDMVSPEACRC